MTRVARMLGLAIGLGGALIAFGCQSIVGIEERTLETCDEACVQCEHYCDLAMTNCTGEHAVYNPEARDTCLGICKELPPGDPREPGDDNTVACRMHQAELAVSTGEPDEHCSGVGPGGGGICGTDCESYCYLYPRICPGGFPYDECLHKCAALEDGPDYNVDEYYDSDSLECRLIHLANSTADPMHCSHADFQSSKHCMPPEMAEPDCADYCRVVMVACDGERSLYDSTAECLATCPHLTPGLNGEQTGNTVGCRQYHSYSSLLDPARHCTHAGPGGAGHCGDDGGIGNCESYCMLAKVGCASEYGVAFTSDADCRAACQDLKGVKDDPATMDVHEGEQYSVALAEAGPLSQYLFQCRLLHVTRALALGVDDPVECASALGSAGSACPPP